MKNSKILSKNWFPLWSVFKKLLFRVSFWSNQAYSYQLESTVRQPPLMMKDPCRWKLHKVPEVESHSEYLSSVLTWKKLFITSGESEPPSWAKLTVQSVEKSKIQWASVRKHQRIGVFHQVRLRHQTFSNFFRVIFSYFPIF